MVFANLAETVQVLLVPSIPEGLTKNGYCWSHSVFFNKHNFIKYFTNVTQSK